MSYQKASQIVDKILTSLSPDLCMFGDKFPEAYKYLLSFRADLIGDVKEELEEKSYIEPYKVRKASKSTKPEVKLFINSGNLRSVLEKDGELSEEGIDFLIDFLCLSFNI